MSLFFWNGMRSIAIGNSRNPVGRVRLMLGSAGLAPQCSFSSAAVKSPPSGWPAPGGTPHSSWHGRRARGIVASPNKRTRSRSILERKDLVRTIEPPAVPRITYTADRPCQRPAVGSHEDVAAANAAGVEDTRSEFPCPAIRPLLVAETQ